MCFSHDVFSHVFFKKSIPNILQCQCAFDFIAWKYIFFNTEWYKNKDFNSVFVKVVILFLILKYLHC